ncbi:hypothetical protein NHQ30_002996 [Ciborinia camelliae]|nr:hypothetical protein NHQ30_002996 [Ciborinia camelliae]
MANEGRSDGFGKARHKSLNATLTDSFLDFSASRGNNLRAIGLSGGNQWCLCAGRWKEAMNAAKNSGEMDLVPLVHLHATHERALWVFLVVARILDV